MLVQMGDLPTPDNGILSQTLWNGQGKPVNKANPNATSDSRSTDSQRVKIKQERVSSSNLASKEQSHIASNLQVFSSNSMANYDTGSMQQMNANRASTHDNDSKSGNRTMVTNPGP